MHALVTGATGFMGGALTRRLVTQGARVTAFVRSLERAAHLQRLGVECVAVDIGDRDSVANAFKPFDRVFHIAALYRSEDADVGQFARINVDATRHLVEASREHGVGRFIHCSTVGVQGGIDAPPADENYRFHPEDHYQQTKLEGELVAREFMAKGLPGAAVRPAGIYGPGDTRFLKLFKGINRGWFVMIGTGTTLYHFTYIDDLIDGFLVLGEPRPGLRIPAWPVEAAAVVCAARCRPLRINPPLYPRRLEFFTLDRSFTIAKARTRLGYEPRVSLREGFARTAEWRRQQGLL